jgi:hypothetical protein
MVAFASGRCLHARQVGLGAALGIKRQIPIRSRSSAAKKQKSALVWRFSN